LNGLAGQPGSRRRAQRAEVGFADLQLLPSREILRPRGAIVQRKSPIAVITRGGNANRVHVRVLGGCICPAVPDPVATRAEASGELDRQHQPSPAQPRGWCLARDALRPSRGSACRTGRVIDKVILDTASEACRATAQASGFADEGREACLLARFRLRETRCRIARPFVITAIRWTGRWSRSAQREAGFLVMAAIEGGRGTYISSRETVGLCRRDRRGNIK